jgi:hypothetical protein
LIYPLDADLLHGVKIEKNINWISAIKSNQIYSQTMTKAEQFDAGYIRILKDIKLQ